MRGGSDSRGFFSSLSSRFGARTGLSATELMPAPTELRNQRELYFEPQRGNLSLE
jgi:hypothetical protein